MILTRTEAGTRMVDTAVTDLITSFCGGKIMENTLELRARKATECSKPGELFCRDLEVRMLRKMQMIGTWLVKF